MNVSRISRIDCYKQPCRRFLRKLPYLIHRWNDYLEVRVDRWTILTTFKPRPVIETDKRSLGCRKTVLIPRSKIV